MLDLGWSELLLIGAVTVVVMKPEDIPKAMMGLGHVMRRMQYVKFALSQQFDDIMKAGDLDELRKANFERSKDLPDIDEADGDLEDYNESLTRSSKPSAVIPAQAGEEEQTERGLRPDNENAKGDDGVRYD